MFKGLINRFSFSFLIGFTILFLILPHFLPRFYIYFFSLIFVTGLLATSLNMVLGYGGMYQFHHAVFYGVGAYTFALMLIKTNLSPIFAFIAAPIASAIIGLIMGLICVRLSKLYFGMLQISLGSLVWAIVFRWYSFTGGDNGIHGIPIPSIISSTSKAYYFTFIITLISLIVMYMIVNSPFGRIFQAIRDNPERSEAIGVNVKRHQLIGLVIAAFFGGIAGTLFVVVEGSVFPDLMFWTFSLEILIMCLLGGWFTFLGPFLGASIIVTLRTVIGIYTEYWTLVLGIILMLLIFFLPEGVLGYFTEKYKGRFKTPIVNKE
ncbi:MAG: branched-chain amino acid ABC transporter permease [Spirochaetes bacterium]|nr:branched-chain amino acid ABC transporter permease [Deltaproteobacteria bacterium]RKY02246.1 MAG: branched-chain amino acid ABC transporter permease [Spirochaetota bacterium]